MDDEQISRLVNQFVRTFRKFGGAKQDFSQDFVIGFRENKHKGYQELVAAARENANEFDTTFEFPKLEGDELDQTIQLAGYLSLKLRDYELSRKKAKGGRTTASRMTPEQRSASAKKAAKARWEREEMAKMEEPEFSTSIDIFVIHYNDGERSEELWHKLELFTQEYNRRNSTNISVEEFIKKNTR